MSLPSQLWSSTSTSLFKPSNSLLQSHCYYLLSFRHKFLEIADKSTRMATQEENKACKTLQKSYFDVLGICCSSEVGLIDSILKALDGVKEVSVIVPTRTVIVVHDTALVSQLQIVRALNQARLEANVRAYGGKKFQKKWPSPSAVACGLLLMLSFLKYVYRPLHWLALGAVVVGIFPILLKAYVSITNFRLDINILMLIAVIGTIAMDDYTEAGTIVFLFTIAQWLETRACHKATATMSSLMSVAPQKAVIAESGEEVDVDEVKLNTIIAIKSGEVIPIDGIVEDGKCEVDEKTLTGESFPVAKEKDSIVWAGTINLNGYVHVKTTAIAKECAVAKMTKLVEEAQNSRTRIQRFIDRCAKYYTPAVVLISAGVAVVPVALRVHNHKHWFYLALVVLVSACPCALILSTPVVTFCALSKAATTGLLVKGGDYLEILAKIKITAFDKTGTITRGEFVVNDFQSLCDDIDFKTLIRWVSSIESKSSHPMATAIVEYGRSLSIEPKPEYVEDFQNFPGEGVFGIVDRKDIYIGNRRISQRACGTVPSLGGDISKGKTVGYVYCGSKLIGIFSLSDACRTGVFEAMNELKSMGIKTAMLTGDNPAAAAHVQEQLRNSLEIVHAELLPEDKARIIKEFKAEKPTAMIGDGLNDAPALATADIGISMGISGSALATETGHVILMSNDIRKIPMAIQLAKKAHWKLIENVILSIGTKAAILALGIAGHPLVWAAVLADVGTCLLVILNSMLLLKGNKKRLQQEKCYRSSAEEDAKRCSTGLCISPYDQGCSDKKVESACESKCCSRKTSSRRQPSPSDLKSFSESFKSGNGLGLAKKHGAFIDSDQCSESMGCNDGNCNMAIHDIQQPKVPSGCCSGTNGSSNKGCSGPQKLSSGCCPGVQNLPGDCCSVPANLSDDCCSVPPNLSDSCCQASENLSSNCCLATQNTCSDSYSGRLNSSNNCCPFSENLSRSFSEIQKSSSNSSLGSPKLSSSSSAIKKKSGDCCLVPPKPSSNCCSGSQKVSSICSGVQDLSRSCCSVPQNPSGNGSSSSKTLSSTSSAVQNSSSNCCSGAQTLSSNCCSRPYELRLCIEANCKNSLVRQTRGKEATEPSDKKQCQQVTDTGHCQSIPCGRERVDIDAEVEALQAKVKHCCEKKPNPEASPYDQKCCKEYAESSQVCMSVEKREVGGCCKSYMKECCYKDEHLGSGFGGGLTEIVSE